MYRTIPDFPNYRVNERGTVVSYARGKRRRLRIFRDGRGYPAVSIYRDGKERRVNVHRVVLETFVGPCPAGMETRHLDGNPANNRLDNLRYGTPAENQSDRIRHGTDGRGERNGRAKLAEWQAVEALWLYENVTQNRAEIARRLGVGPTAVSRILTGESWAHLAA